MSKGAELDVLEGIEDQHWPLIRQLVLEVAPANKTQLNELKNHLRSLGFERVVIEDILGNDKDLGPGPCNVYAVREAL